MKSTEKLHALGQSLWLDNITRTLLDDGTLARYIRWCSVTGLTSNPSIFQKAMAEGDAYDADIAAASADTATEALFIRMALADIVGAADLFHETHVRSNGTDGWASMEVSPLLADDAAATVRAAKRLRRHAGRDNVFIKIPGTPAGLEAIEQSTFAGIPINVTLLFSRDQYLAAADARIKGIERRLDAGLDPRVHSVASLFVSRWDVAVSDRVPDHLKNGLGIAVAMQTWRAYRELLFSPRWHRLAQAGAPIQRLLWASTGTKDPDASDVLYVEALAAPDTINTMPEKTLLAFADHGRIDRYLTEDGADGQAVIDQCQEAGIDVDQLAGQLQRDGTAAFIQSWNALMAEIERKRKA
jgi:transaldolase